MLLHSRSADGKDVEWPGRQHTAYVLTSAVAAMQVQFRARNELQAPVQWADQKEWIKLSAQVLNVSQLAAPVQILRGHTCASEQYHH